MANTRNKSAVAATPDLSPLALHRETNHLEFVLRGQQEIMVQLPADYEQVLAERLAEVLAEPEPLTAEINLHQVAGISSRQLGSLIALGKVLRPRFGRVRVTNVAPAVRHLMEMTRTDQLFQLA